MSFFSAFKHVSLPKARSLVRLCGFLLIALLLSSSSPAVGVELSGLQSSEAEHEGTKQPENYRTGYVLGMLLGSLFLIVSGIVGEVVDYVVNQVEPQEEASAKSVPRSDLSYLHNTLWYGVPMVTLMGIIVYGATKYLYAEPKGLVETNSSSHPQGNFIKKKTLPKVVSETTVDASTSWWSSNGLYVILVTAAILIGGGASTYVYRRGK